MTIFTGLRRILRIGNRHADGEHGCLESPSGPVECSPEPVHDPAELYRLALWHCERDDSDAAEQALKEAIELRHDYAEAHFLLGQIYHRKGEWDDAGDCYVLAVHFRPDLWQAHVKLGQLALDRGRFGEACEHLSRAVALKDDDAEAHNALGAALHGLKELDAAVSHFRRAIELKPDFAEAYSNLGYVLFREFEQFEEGAGHIKTALALAPDNEAANCNWTMVLQQQGRFDEALELSDRLLAANPDLHEVRLNRGLILLTRGKFQDGWQDYEARKHMRDFPKRNLPWKEWRGEPLEGRNIYLYGEQGLGDEIMFASCLPDAMRRAGRCIVECSPKLEILFRRSFPGAHVVGSAGNGVRTIDEDLYGRVDYQAPLGSLPKYFRRSALDFPQHEGYLRADPARVAFWKKRLDGLNGGPKIGISWRGGVHSTRSTLRSLALEQLYPVLSCDGATFVSLQYNERGNEIAALREARGLEVHHWQEAINDYDETAALVCALDLVITVQTAIAHLAGALGRTAWVMIAAVPEWRYMRDGDTMPWYPSVRLIRQRTAGDWNGVISAVAERVKQFIEQYRT